MQRALLVATLPNIQRVIKRCASTSVTMAQKIAIVNYTSERDRIELSFKYGTDDLPERQFNFNRSSDENVGCALTRIATNINSQLEKKTKRKKSKKSAEAEEQPKLQNEVEVTLKYQDEVVGNNQPNNEAWKEGAVLEVGSQKYVVSLNAPSVRSIRLPKVIMAGFPVFPHVELEYADVQHSTALWYKSNIRGQSYPASETRTVSNMHFVNSHEGNLSIIPSSSDIGRHLLLVFTPRSSTKHGIPVEVTSSTSIEAGPGPCPFETRHAFTTSYTEPGRFRCISYNILADVYADTKYTKAVLFPYCPPYALDVGYRKLLLVKEILGYRGDVICLQEVDRKVYQYDLEPLFNASGLNGFYTEKGGNLAEGMACFYRASKFRCLEKESIILSKTLAEVTYLSDILYSINQNTQLRDRMLNLPTALQVVLLECVENKNRFLLVANTHLYFHPDSDHIRLLQAYCCIRTIQWLCTEYTEKYGVSPAVVFAGDFNSCPEFGVYKLMTTGHVSESSPDWQSNVVEAVSGLEAVQTIPLKSACGTPEYTNYTTGFQGCLDYIFFEDQKLAVDEVVPMPSHEEITCHQALPSIVFPSDHIAQIASLKWL
ncbi:2',5'-phosphodiesterase 12-like [Ornithodoros turicata]|uniref:2',5'-phosphodiesterase 12-like n=1 Tax=Ornithodoros turicata TaxID=34597 RepID=UPI00313A270E